MFRRKSFYLLLILLVVLFSIPIIEQITGLSSTPTLMQVIGFSVTLIGVFGGVYFELERFEKQLQEEKSKEQRLHKLATLATIEHWIDELSTVIEDIGTLVELNSKYVDKLSVNRDQEKIIQEKLLRLDYQFTTITMKTLDILGFRKDETNFDNLPEEQRVLIEELMWLGLSLKTSREIFSIGAKIPSITPYNMSIAECKTAIDKIRLNLK